MILPREQFEQWIQSPPYERMVERFPDDPTLYSWPGQYRDYNTQLAYEAMQEGFRLGMEAAARLCVAKSDNYDQGGEEERSAGAYVCAEAIRVAITK